ncbi:MAG: M20/M25/M40 family metallo-hydrolase [Candidatus Bathyarchaeia archaeon]
MEKLEKYAVQFLARLLKIYSPSRKEHKIGTFIADEMEKLNFKVRVDDVGNVIGEVGHGKPVVLLCGHMDTVPGYIPVRIINNEIYGRGAVDAKASLASMILAAHLVGGTAKEGKIVMACVVDEEKTSIGIKHLIEGGVSADYAIFGEPSGTENVVIGYKGNLMIELTCKTITGHSSTPWLFENAIEKMFELWGRIKKIRFQEETQNSFFYNVSTCLTRLEGGGYASNVPSKCKALIDVRIPPQLTCTQVYNKINECTTQFKRENPQVQIEVRVVDSIESFETDKDSILVRAFSAAIRKETGKTPKLLRKTGTSDMNLLGKVLKIPVVAYGPGDSSLDHTPNEHISIQDYLSSVRVLQEVLKKLLNLP